MYIHTRYGGVIRAAVPGVIRAAVLNQCLHKGSFLILVYSLSLSLSHAHSHSYSLPLVSQALLTVAYEMLSVLEPLLSLKFSGTLAAEMACLQVWMSMRLEPLASHSLSPFSPSLLQA